MGMEVSEVVLIRGKLVLSCEEIILTKLLYTYVLKLCVGEHVYKMLNNGSERNQNHAIIKIMQ